MFPEEIQAMEETPLSPQGPVTEARASVAGGHTPNKTARGRSSGPSQSSISLQCKPLAPSLQVVDTLSHPVPPHWGGLRVRAPGMEPSFQVARYPC
jgi:hypothetical protein